MSNSTDNFLSSMWITMSDLDVNYIAKLGLARLAVTAASVPLWEYGFIVLIASCVLVYRFVDVHLVSHFFTGDSAKLFYNTQSEVAKEVLRKMTFDRFWPTPWLCSAHLQTTFLHFFAVAPAVNYRRELLTTADGGTLGLDWADPLPDGSSHISPEQDNTPIVVMIPGLTSDSKSQYIKHAVDATLNKGWRAAVANHRGLGGVPLTSKTFYTAGWTQDLRFILKHIKQLYPSAPVAALGASLGANILVKYLGEEGQKTDVFAAAAVGCPWDLVVVDRWMGRSSRQKLYGIGLIYGLKEFAHMHKKSFSEMVDWDVLNKSRTVREFDDRITRLMGKFETVDTYYRRCSSAQFLPGVAIPLLGISALDDPICTREAIPWDECRANRNVILGVTAHGGHLSYLEGMTANRIWWARHVVQFFKVILDSPSLLHQKQNGPEAVRLEPSSMDDSPLVTLSETAEGTPSIAPIITPSPLDPPAPIFESVNGGNYLGIDNDRDDKGEDETERELGGSSENQNVVETIAQRGMSEAVPQNTEEGRELRNGNRGEEIMGGGNVEQINDGDSNRRDISSEHELVIRVGGREEMDVLQSVLVNLLKAVQKRSQTTQQGQSTIGSSGPNPETNVLLEGENSVMTASSSVASSALAIAQAAASITESASLILSMVQSVDGTDTGRTVPRTIHRFGHTYQLSLRAGDSIGGSELARGESQVGDVANRMTESLNVIGRQERMADKVTLSAEVLGRGLGDLESQNRMNTRLMAYVAVASTCPLVISAIACRAYLKRNGNKSLLEIFK